MELEAAIQGAYLRPGSEPGSKAAGSACWLGAQSCVHWVTRRGQGICPGNKSCQLPSGQKGQAAHSIPQKKKLPPARRQIYSQQPVGCDPARSLPAKEKPQMPVKCER